MRDWTSSLTDQEKADIALLGFDWNDRVEMDLAEIARLAVNRRGNDLLSRLSALPISDQVKIVADTDAALTAKEIAFAVVPQEGTVQAKQ